jgi:hypothetical protein
MVYLFCLKKSRSIYPFAGSASSSTSLGSPRHPQSQAHPNEQRKNSLQKHTQRSQPSPPTSPSSRSRRRPRRLAVETLAAVPHRSHWIAPPLSALAPTETLAHFPRSRISRWRRGSWIDPLRSGKVSRPICAPRAVVDPICSARGSA